MWANIGYWIEKCICKLYLRDQSSFSSSFSISTHRHLIDDYVPCMSGVTKLLISSNKYDNYIQWCSVVKTMYSWLIISCVVGEQIVVSVLWSCQVWDIVQHKLGAGSTVQWFSDRRSIYMSLSLYGYVYMCGCVCIVVFYCQMVLVGWLDI
jgi:hypothetical protein